MYMYRTETGEGAFLHCAQRLINMSFHDSICRRLDGISEQTSGGTKKK